MLTLKKPTKRDAELLLQMSETFNTPEMRDAMTWFMKDFSAKDYKEFKSKYPDGSPGDQNLGMMLGQFETAGVLVSHGLLNENLYFDVSGIGFVWPKVEKIVQGMQKEMGPALWENAVWLAQRQKWWAKNVWKPNQKWKKA